MALFAHGSNKWHAGWRTDVTHRTVQAVTLQLLLARWREQGLPIGSVMALYHLYTRDMDHTSAFSIWWDMWRLLRGRKQLEMLKGISLVDPDFVEDMLLTWYRSTECFGSALEDLD